MRRYFIEAVPKGKEYDYSNPAVQGVSFCNELFKYEDKYKNKVSHIKNEVLCV